MALDGGIPADRLREFIERIESLEQRHAVITAEIAAAVGEAAAAGFDTKIMRQVIQLRGLDVADRRKHDRLLDQYKEAVGIDVHECWF